MHSSTLRIFGIRTVSTVTLTALMCIGCSNTDNAARDTASAGGTISADANAPDEQAKTYQATMDEVETYRLTMNKVNRYFDAFRDATIAAGNRAESDSLSDFESIDQLVKEIEREPKVVAAVRKAGLSVREYVVMTFAMMSAGLANEVLKTQPNANIDSLARELEVPAANIRFVREHQAEIEQKGNEAKAAVRAAGVSID